MRSGNRILCIRFERADYARAMTLSAKENLPLSSWMREVALSRATQVVNKMLSEPRTGSAQPGPVQVCIRFDASDYKMLQKAAAIESTILSAWVRAAVVQAARRLKKTG